jgi:succinate dehydrogenase / fumarate reductase membrane anchor subunit
MRFSGVALVFLALGHLFIMLMWDDGVYRIDFNYVAQRWASPFWQIWDMALLWLAMITAPTACARSSATTPARTSPSSI